MRRSCRDFLLFLAGSSFTLTRHEKASFLKRIFFHLAKIAGEGEPRDNLAPRKGAGAGIDLPRVDRRLSVEAAGHALAASTRDERHAGTMSSKFRPAPQVSIIAQRRWPRREGASVADFEGRSEERRVGKGGVMT